MSQIEEFNDVTVEMFTLTTAEHGEEWETVRDRFDRIALAKHSELYDAGLLIVHNHDTGRIELVGARTLKD